MVRFQKEVYLFPRRLDENGILRRAFGALPADPARAPHDTTLRRALLERLCSGRPLTPRAGACFLLPDDLDWGAQVYRTQKFPWRLLGN